MKMTFEGDIHDIIAQMEKVFALLAVRAIIKEGGATHAAVQASKPQNLDINPFVNEPPVVKPVQNPVNFTEEKPKRTRTEKQLANDEKLRERAQAKKAAGIKPFTKAAPKSDPVLPPPPPPPATAESLGLDPNEVVNLRNRTITDLQEAYANGHQQEVFELLSRFGNGAKSFRELPPESFVPISEAISKGALT